MRIRDWSSDVGSSDLLLAPLHRPAHIYWLGLNYPNWPKPEDTDASVFFKTRTAVVGPDETIRFPKLITVQPQAYFAYEIELVAMIGSNGLADRHNGIANVLGYTIGNRSEEHTSELQSLMRNSYAVFCLKK